MSLEETTLKIMFSGLVVSILNHSFNFGEKYTKVVNSDFLEPKEKKKKKRKETKKELPSKTFQWPRFVCFGFLCGARLRWSLLRVREYKDGG